MVDGAKAIVAVTGARGLVGKAVIRQLSEAGFSVRRLSRTGLQDGESDWAILPRFDAPDEAFDASLAGATHIVHAAGLTNADATTSEADYMNANALLTERLAAAARRAISGRFVLISSIRAVAGQGFAGVIDATTEAAPTCAYGRSKRAGEIAAARIFANAPERLCILRPAPVYGHGMKGNLGKLLQLARKPYPLPLGGLKNRRTLLDVEALARAVIHALTAPAPIGGAYIVSDKEPIAIVEILAAFRSGMGRPARLFPIPSFLLEAAASAAGQRLALRGLFAEEICNPSALETTGWVPTESSIDGLAALAGQGQDRS
jgi:UDP-glucose 4-epimerase